MKNVILASTVAILSILMSQHLIADSPEKQPFAEIKSLQLQGNLSLTGRKILIVRIFSNVDGEAILNFRLPKAMKNSLNESQIDKQINLTKNTTFIDTLEIYYSEILSSMIYVSLNLKSENNDYYPKTSEYINIDYEDNNEFTIYTSTDNDSTYYGPRFKSYKFFEDTVIDTLVDAGKKLRIFRINGTVQAVDRNEDPPRFEGLLGSTIKLYFRDKNHPTTLYSLGYSDIIDENGSFDINFSTNADLSSYQEIVLLVGKWNEYIIYYSKNGFVIRTNQGQIFTFGSSEGIRIPFNPQLTYNIYNNLFVEINEGDGTILRSMQIAGEFLKQRYNNNIPYYFPKVTVCRKDITNSGEFIYDSNGNCRIHIGPSGTNASTTSHEFGHYVNYRMYGWEDYKNTDLQMKEGWSVFYSFAARNYGEYKYKDWIMTFLDNPEESCFLFPRFFGMKWAEAGHPEYSAFTCYLWNIYDSYIDKKSIIYNYMDNDDVSNLGLRVFETMNQMAGKSPQDFNARFKSGLPNEIQGSIQKIYDFTLVDRNKEMCSPQIKDVFANIGSSNITFNWESQAYPESEYANKEEYYSIYKESDPGNWILIASVPYQSTSYTYNTSNPYEYNYKITSSNNAGNSCNASYLNYRLLVDYTGETSLYQPSHGYYNAVVSGGSGNYVYTWATRYPNKPWNNVGSGSFFSLSPLYSYDFVDLKLTVTSGQLVGSCIKTIELYPWQSSLIDSSIIDDQVKIINISNNWISISTDYFLEQVEIFDLSGKLIYYSMPRGQFSETINLKKGVYIIKVLRNESWVIKKILI